MDPSELLEGYLGALVPLVLPMLVVPLRDWRGLPDWAVQWYKSMRENLQLQNHVVDKHFLFTEKAFRQGRWWTAITYMFHHHDAEHLLGNLFSLTWMGRPVYARFGATGLYTVFFAGGVMAAVDLQNKNWQLSEWFGNLVSNPFPKSWGPVASWFEDTTKGLSRWISPYISPYVAYKGASAGVFACMGTTACLKLEDLVYMSQRPGEYSTMQKLLLGVDLSMLVFRVTEEYNLLANGQQFGVDHAGHVDGFVVGVACYVLFRIGGTMLRYYRKKRWQGIGGGRRVGRKHE